MMLTYVRIPFTQQVSAPGRGRADCPEAARLSLDFGSTIFPHLVTHSLRFPFVVSPPFSVRMSGIVPTGKAPYFPSLPISNVCPKGLFLGSRDSSLDGVLARPFFFRSWRN